MFEMGFEPQIRDIMQHVAPGRQTLLFSATLPEQLAQFTRAGLKDPELVRLDADIKIPPDLQIQFLSVRKEEKDGALLFLLHRMIESNQLAIIGGDVSTFQKRPRKVSGNGNDDDNDQIEEEEADEDIFISEDTAKKLASLPVAVPVAPKHAPKSFRDEQFFMDNAPPRHLENRAVAAGYAGADNTSRKIEDAMLELAPEETDAMVKRKSTMRWDKRKKKYVQVNLRGNESILEKSAKLKNESGVVVSRNAKSKSIYEEWKKNKRKVVQTAGEEGFGGDSDNDEQGKPSKKHKGNPKGNAKGQKGNQSITSNNTRSELKSEKELRERREKIAERRKSPHQKKMEKQEFLRKRIARKSKSHAAPARSKKIVRKGK
eukprot:c5738_g1_i1.p1 GENE.c5738_g1_i1~~c5738_g1_i1.p1  ORF type:complete len:374 (+),score=112.79 c5738_g1_i1:2-1123(+)